MNVGLAMPIFDYASLRFSLLMAGGFWLMAYG